LNGEKRPLGWGAPLTHPPSSQKEGRRQADRALLREGRERKKNTYEEKRNYILILRTIKARSSRKGGPPPLPERDDGESTLAVRKKGEREGVLLQNPGPSNSSDKRKGGEKRDLPAECLPSTLKTDLG